ncbi:PEP-CTERM sorting domain-containing protein [Oxalobacteraceae bacterium]|nr:PEP-CTERM sorting domain-containing protein [Oxalobacteraceae bacterium]
MLAAHSSFTLNGHVDGSVTRYGSGNFFGGSNVIVTLTMGNWGDTLGQYKKELVLNEFENGGSYSENFNLFYANDSDVAVELAISFAAHAGADTVTPVPEPSTYAMLGMGLLMVGALARRRG